MTRFFLFRFAAPLVFCLICGLCSVFLANAVYGAFGDIVAQYTFPASSFVMSPTEPVMYATIPSQNSVAIINTSTLVVEDTVFVGSGPTNLAFSPDGSKAYIANSTSNFVAVFDTQSRTVIDSFVLPEQPQDVVFGTLNRLWVLGDTQIFQIDATTGASTGPNVSGVFVYSGSLEISPDRNTLY
jgi:YVTN family beta-propeller protein